MIRYLYHPYVRLAMLLVLAGLMLADCEPDDVPGSGRW